MITIQAYIEEFEQLGTTLEISTDNITFTAVNVFNDDGIAGDLAAGDGIYTAEFSNTFSVDQLYYRLAMSDGSTYPCDSKMMWLTSPTTGIMINEIMTQNTNFISDENGEYDDWVELYNAGQNDINLTGYYLTDDINNPNKFPLPAVTLGVGDFLLIWLDDDLEQGPLHASFRMGATDNTLWLMRTQTGVLRIQDGFSPCLSGANQSVERITDGGQEIVMTSDPTPGYSNVTNIIENANTQIVIFPNPVQSELHFSLRVASCTLLDLTGRELDTYRQIQNIRVDHLATGHYLLRFSDGSVHHFVKVD
jgi:hypothetical protein